MSPSEGKSHHSAAWKRYLTSEGKAGGGVSGFRQGIDQLLYGDKVFLFAGVQVF